MSNLNIMEKLQIRLIQAHPFYASLVSQMRKIEVTGELAKEIPTEAVAIRNGRIEFYYNMKFLETLTVEEAVAVLTHECNHLILGHCTRMRDEYKTNSALANIAQDMNANRHIEHLPKGACTVDSITKQFAEKGIKLNLKDDDTSENYFKELNKHSNKMEIEGDGEGNFDITIKDPKGNTIGKMKVKGVCANKKDQNKGNGDKDKDGKGLGGQDIPELAKEVIRQAIKEAVSQNSKQQGNLPMGMTEEINEWLKPPIISWRTLLKQFVAVSVRSGHKQSWKRPNRRFGEEQKGRLAARTVSITVAIDTSGSVGDEDLASFITEIRTIQACHKSTITVLECDADVQKEYKLSRYKQVQRNFKGRGGTSFVPVFDYVKDKKIKTDILIYFTDLYGDFPSKKPPYTTIWVSTSEHEKAPFGYVISMVKHPDKKK